MHNGAQGPETSQGQDQKHRPLITRELGPEGHVHQILAASVAQRTHRGELPERIATGKS